MTKICFTAIFRNESKNVYRCLDGVKDIIDYISICDTGSEDNTIELINKWSEENNIPAVIHKHRFINFGVNRSLSFDYAKKSFPDCDYCLLVDADMVVKIEKEWDKNSLVADEYMVQQRNSSIKYWNTRLISIKRDWECVGVTHEYWNCRDVGNKFIKTRLNDIWIDDIGDGGHKADKYERDISLLEEGLNNIKTPENIKGRYMFYLAQSYNNVGNTKKSISWYTKRIEHGGWSEELFYSQMQIGLLLQKLKSYERASGELLKAWQMRPTRSEPLYHISNMYRENGDNMLAYTFAKIGINIKFPEEDSLFVNHNIYNYKFHEEISITAFYNKKYIEGNNACKFIINSTLAPESAKTLAKSNIIHYTNK